jgi:LPS O-antigen subunit length determinant protein (WzzB/FepE family)
MTNKNLDEYDINLFFNAFKDYKLSILVLTAIITLLSFLYASSIKTLYSIDASFIPTNDSSLIEINNYSFLREECLRGVGVFLQGKNPDDGTTYCYDQERVMKNFLNLIQSSNFQSSVYIKNGYPEIESINGFISTVNIQDPIKNTNPANISKYILNMKGSNPDLMERYISDLLQQANYETIKQIIEVNESLINLKKASLEVLKDEMLYSEIQLIQREISVLEGEVNKAKASGIIENNFIMNDNSKFDIDQSLKLLVNVNEVPRWFIYGEKALLGEVKELKKRLNEINFSPDIDAVTQRIERLKSLEKPNISEINAIRITNTPVQSNITKNKKIYIILGLFFGFIFSVFQALIRQIFRQTLKD